MQPSNPQISSSTEMPDVNLFVKMSDHLIIPSPIFLHMILSVHTTAVRDCQRQHTVDLQLSSIAGLSSGALRLPPA